MQEDPEVAKTATDLTVQISALGHLLRERGYNRATTEKMILVTYELSAAIRAGVDFSSRS